MAELSLPRISVIICTHNPRLDYLQRTLEALQGQTLPLDQWELLVIDNASREPVGDQYDISWHPRGRHISETTLGLTPARLRGVAESQTGLLVFVDDDNILDADYLVQALRISRDYSFLGAWGGQIRPEFEAEPPEWTKPYWGMLAIVELERDEWSNCADHRAAAPCGAGMCIRRTVANRYAEVLLAAGKDHERFQLDRRGTHLASCGDSDLALTACDLGMGCGRFTSLRLTHLIPSVRLTTSYLVRLTEELTYSAHMLRAVRGNLPTEPRRQTLAQRALHQYFRLRIPTHERDMLDARNRGEKRAFDYLSRVTLHSSTAQGNKCGTESAVPRSCSASGPNLSANKR